MSVVDAVSREVDVAQAKGSALAETALALARELDARNSATSKSMCAKSMIEVLREMRSLATPQREKDELDELRQQRQDRIARRAASSGPTSS